MHWSTSGYPHKLLSRTRPAASSNHNRTHNFADTRNPRGLTLPAQESSDYRSISLLRLVGKVYAKCQEKSWHEIVEPNLDDTLCDFRASRSTTDQFLTLQQILELIHGLLRQT